jgi:hypothetical protein
MLDEESRSQNSEVRMQLPPHGLFFRKPELVIGDGNE